MRSWLLNRLRTLRYNRSSPSLSKEHATCKVALQSSLFAVVDGALYYIDPKRWKSQMGRCAEATIGGDPWQSIWGPIFGVENV